MPMDKEDIKWLIDTVLTVIQIVLTVILADKAKSPDLNADSTSQDVKDKGMVVRGATLATFIIT